MKNSSAYFSNILPMECQSAREEFRAYVENNLTTMDAKNLEQHLNNCVHCRAELKAKRSLYQIMDNTLGARSLASNFDERAEQMLKNASVLDSKTKGIMDDMDENALLTDAVQSNKFNFMFSATPWWFVSIALHVLVILLAGLISMSLEMPTAEDAVVIITELQPAPQIKQIEPEKPKIDNRVVLESKHDTPPTDPNASNPSDIVVPPEILEKAELGDHFETINPDRPDTHSAFGNPESHIFYSEKG